MAHLAEQTFCLRTKETFPEYFKGVNVCDIGSLDLNGNNHYLFEDYSYVGIDIGRGPNVNIVSKGHEFKPLDGKKYDTVISTEVFEHDMYWKETIQNNPNGLGIEIANKWWCRVKPRLKVYGRIYKDNFVNDMFEVLYTENEK